MESKHFVNGMTLTACCGYGNESFIQSLSESCASSMIVLPDQLLKVHPFVGRSYFHVGCDDSAAENGVPKTSSRSIGMEKQQTIDNSKMVVLTYRTHSVIETSVNHSLQQVPSENYNVQEVNIEVLSI